jgi:DNA replication protein DnaD
MTRVVLFASSLKDILISSQEHSDWTLYLVSHPLVIKELFLDCPSLEKRKIMSGVIKTSIKSASSEGLCMFAYKWLSVLPKARVPQSFNFCNYFELLLSVIETNPDLVVLFSIQLRLFEYCNKDQVQVDHEEIEENMQEEVLGYSQKASTTTELSKSELGESFEHLFSCVTFCSIYYDSSQLEHLCNEQVFCYLFENCRNKAGCRSLASMYLALAHSDRKCFQLIVQLLIEKLRTGQSNELIQTGTNDKSYENSMKLMRLLYLLVMGFKPMNSEAIEQILNVLMKISCSKLEKKEDPYCILFYTKKMIAINLDIRKLAQKKMKNLRDLEGILSNLMQNTQGQGKDLTRLKYCIENFQVIRKLVKNEVKNYFLEDSDTELKDFEISPGSELLHYNHEMSTWIKSTVTMNCEELICIRYENSSVQKWLDPQSDLLHRV